MYSTTIIKIVVLFLLFMEIAEIKVSYSRNNTIKEKISCSKSAYDLLLSNWDKDILELQEEFKILLLNNSNQTLGIYSVAKGGTSFVGVDSKLVFSVALKCNATAIILAHNHPSGKLFPSESDKELTRKLKTASEYLDICVLDHIIVTKNGYFSFKDSGELE